MTPRSPDALATMRRLILILLAIGQGGLATELLLLAHYEDSWQLVPLFFIAIGLGTLVWHAASGDRVSLIAFRTIMACFIVVGLIGVILHFRGNLEFQLDMDASQSSWDLFRKVMRAKAPPALAPGAMAQLGLLGLIYTYRHPALGRRGPLDVRAGAHE